MAKKKAKKKVKHQVPDGHVGQVWFVFIFAAIAVLVGLYLTLAKMIS
jgi:hypothetical protein